MEQVGPGGNLWLRKKPFSVPPSYELRECLLTFTHIVDRLGLGVRPRSSMSAAVPAGRASSSRVAAAGSPASTSPRTVRIAARIDAIEEPIGEGIEALAEFHAIPVLELPWTNRFDAAILYDAMHHVDNELKTLR